MNSKEEFTLINGMIWGFIIDDEENRSILRQYKDCRLKLYAEGAPIAKGVQKITSHYLDYEGTVLKEENGRICKIPCHLPNHFRE